MVFGNLNSMFSNGTDLWFGACSKCNRLTQCARKKDDLEILLMAKNAGWLCAMQPTGRFDLVCTACIERLGLSPEQLEV